MKRFAILSNLALIAAAVILGALVRTVDARRNVSYLDVQAKHYEACEAIAWKSVECESSEDDGGN